MMKKSYVLDSFAIIAYLRKEKAGQRVKELLSQAKKGKAIL